MKIKKIEVENFKSLKKLSIENLLTVNMVYGYNNSGKSNLFKLLELIFSRGSYLEGFEVQTGSKSSIESVKKLENFWEKSILNQPFIFRHEKGKAHDISYSITFELDLAYLNKEVLGFDNIKKEYITGNPTTVDLTIQGTIKQLSTYQAQQKLTNVFINDNNIFTWDEVSNSPKTFENSSTLTYNNFISLLSIFNDCILHLDNDRYFVVENEIETSDILFAKNFKNKIFSLSLSYDGNIDYRELGNFLKSFQITSTDSVFNNNEKSSPFKDFQFEFIRLNKEIELMLTNEFGKFPVTSFGTGIQQIIFILSKIFLSKKKIVLIEEVELNLSPKYQLELINFIFNNLVKKNGIVSQLFYTTHSPLMCYRTEFRTLQSRIDGSGVSTIEAITPKATDVALFKRAMSLLEHYHPPVKKAPAKKAAPVKKTAKKAAVKKAKKK